MIELLVLCDLLFILLKVGLERWDLEFLGLLVGVDLSGSDELIKGFAWVLGDDVIYLGGIGLFQISGCLQRNMVQETHDLLVNIADAPGVMLAD